MKIKIDTSKKEIVVYKATALELLELLEQHRDYAVVSHQPKIEQAPIYIPPQQPYQPHQPDILPWEVTKPYYTTDNTNSGNINGHDNLTVDNQDIINKQIFGE